MFNICTVFTTYLHVPRYPGPSSLVVSHTTCRHTGQRTCNKPPNSPAVAVARRVLLLRQLIVHAAALSLACLGLNATLHRAVSQRPYMTDL